MKIQSFGKSQTALWEVGGNFLTEQSKLKEKKWPLLSFTTKRTEGRQKTTEIKTRYKSKTCSFAKLLTRLVINTPTNTRLISY